MIIYNHDDAGLPKYLIRLFNNKRYMQKFVATGQLYMNTLEFFRNMEEGFQGDHKEGKLIDKSMHATLEISSTNDFSNPDIVLTDVEWLVNGYVYCFYAAEEDEPIVSEGKIYYNQATSLNLKNAVLQYRKENDGRDIYVVVLDAEKMIPEIEKQLKTVELPGYQGRVEYMENAALSTRQMFEIMSEKPWVSAFVKPQRYQYQKEWRVFIHAKPLADHAELYLTNVGKFIRSYEHIPCSAELI